MASKIKKSSKKKGRSSKTAERIAWATVNKKTGGGAKKRSTKKSTRSRSRKSSSRSHK